MTQEEYTKLRISDTVFRKSDGLIAILESGWSSDKTFNIEDNLWLSDTSPYNGGINFPAKECDKWTVVKSLNNLIENPTAYCNWLNMRINHLEEKLSKKTIL